jgi:hypothetical protein
LWLGSAPQVRAFSGFQYLTPPLRVGLKRKQQAIRSVGTLAIDAAGNPAPLTSPAAYERASVSVPLGTAPSRPTSRPTAARARSASVRRLRLLPARPFLPTCPRSNSTSPGLRANRETTQAIGAVGYVTTNITAEIDAYTGIAEQMRGRLANLTPT